MTTLDSTWARITSFGALCRAARAAARGKRLGRDAQSFLADLECNALELQRQLLAGNWTPGTPHTFFIRDPKPRRISAAPFVDRVVHHALCAVVGPVLESGASDCSFACRKGRGTHAALGRARQLTATCDRYHKLDVEHYFETIDHTVLLGLLQRHVACDATMALLERIVQAGAPGSEPGRGMPIGNLTSQHFANLVLTEVDSVASSHPGARGYVRYMDDMLLFGDSYRELDAAATAASAVVTLHLNQRIKLSATRHGRCSDGVPFLGLRLFSGTVRFDHARARRFMRTARAVRAAAADGSMHQADCARRAQALLNWSDQAGAAGLARLAFAESSR